jgi:hypothetical protein
MALNKSGIAGGCFCQLSPDIKTSTPMKNLILFAFFCAAVGAACGGADSFSFTTGSPDGRLATGSRPGSPGNIEIESADDFILSSPTQITSGTFTGLLPAGAPLTTDIGGGASAPKFNEAFSLAGVPIPDSGSTALLLSIAVVAMFYLGGRVCFAT